MKRDRSKDPPKNAAELMAELQRNPEYLEKERASAERDQENAKRYRSDAEPLVRALCWAGFPVNTIGELRQRGESYPAAIPILLAWLPRIANVQVKEDIVRTLSVPWARPSAAPILIDEFKSAIDPTGTGLRWTIANALEVVADDSVFDAIKELVQDKSYGKAREMLTLSLGNMRRPDAVDMLTTLLEDDETVGHAVIALGRLKAHTASSRIEALLKHPRAWVRRESKRALDNIRRTGH